MKPAFRHPLSTREGFLEWEAEQDERYEFLFGVIKMMAGGSVAHNRISRNVYRHLFALAERRGCEAFQQNQKFAPDHDPSVVYPDVFVTCQKVKDTDQMVPIAVVIAEVLSKSTREDDRNWKWELYREMPELRHYLVIDSTKTHVTHYYRATESEEWRVQILGGRDGTLTIGALDGELPLAAVYAGTDLTTGK